MDSLRNLPVYLRFEEDGSVFAECPLFSSCRCWARSRATALETIQKLIVTALATEGPPPHGHYEIVLLGIRPCGDGLEKNLEGRVDLRGRRSSPG